MIRTIARRSLAVLASLGLATALGSAVPAGADSGSDSLAPVLASHDWLNGTPNASGLDGKVVVVDVFTFGCYNCKNVTPNLKELHSQKGVKIIGIHTPETSYERDRGNVMVALSQLGISWPVAIDNDSTLWNAYGVSYWPTQLIFDKHGKLRKTIVGDSQDDAVDATVKSLLAEN